jgi:peptide/nickel transport system substrate-binding protein
MRARRYLNTALAVTAAAAALSCRPTAHRTPDDAVVYLVEQTIAELDPRYAVSNNEAKLSALVAPGLVTVDNPRLEPVLDLAESLTMVDPLTWDAVIRPDASFSTGNPVTAEDVAFTYRTLIDPAMKSGYYKGYSERIASMEVRDARTVRFHLKQSLATFKSDLIFGIVEARAARPDGRFPGGWTVGAGPYQIQSMKTTEVVLAANPHFYGAKPRVPRLVIKTVTDQSARLLMLVGGSADAAMNGVRPDLLDDVAAKPRLALASGPSALLTYLLMQNEDPILKDVRVRHAIAHAIDREKIIRAKYGGRAALATGLIPPGHWAYDGNVDRYGYDPDLARRLLDEAGFPDPDGPGPRRRFTLSYKTSADQFRIAVARVIAQQLEDVGIGVDLRSFEFATFFTDVKQGKFQLASMQSGNIAEPDMMYHFYHSDRIPVPEDWNRGNRWRYRNPEVDRLLIAGRQEPDQAKRKEIYAQLQSIVARDLPIVPLWHEDNVAVLNKSIEGFYVLPNAYLAAFAAVNKKPN